jgi:hypothetical protein
LLIDSAGCRHLRSCRDDSGLGCDQLQVGAGCCQYNQIPSIFSSLQIRLEVLGGAVEIVDSDKIKDGLIKTRDPSVKNN